MLVWLLAMSACASEDIRVPVATATVNIDRDHVPAGGPLQLTFRFELQPASPRLDANYRVLVRFLGPGGELLWSADHDPPTPTTDWRASQVVTYKRLLIVPVRTFPGATTIAVGLSLPRAEGRLPLSGAEIENGLYRVASVDIGPHDTLLHYGDGWHPREQTRDGLTEWRWTTKEAELAFQNPRCDVRLHLLYAGRPSLFDRPVRATVRIGERELRHLTIDRVGPRFSTLFLDAADLGSADEVHLNLVIDKTFVPSLLPTASPDRGDDRELGIRVWYAFLEASC